MVTPRRRYIERWKVKARLRRQRLQRRLEQSVRPVGAIRRRNWLRRFRVNLARRRAWLETRLAHLHALEQLANSKPNRYEPVQANPRGTAEGGKQASETSPHYRVLQPPAGPASQKVPSLRKIAPATKVTAKPVSVASNPRHIPAGTPIPRQAAGKGRKKK